jgi:hypothetical protein
MMTKIRPEFQLDAASPLRTESDRAVQNGGLLRLFALAISDSWRSWTARIGRSASESADAGVEPLTAARLGSGARLVERAYAFSSAPARWG